jgi:hypothetical protein
MKPGDYVCGFFMDGANSQVPIIMGSITWRTVQGPQKEGTGFSSQRQNIIIVALKKKKHLCRFQMQ